jgi:hypothetical protein
MEWYRVQKPHWVSVIKDRSQAKLCVVGAGWGGGGCTPVVFYEAHLGRRWCNLQVTTGQDRGQLPAGGEPSALPVLS